MVKRVNYQDSFNSLKVWQVCHLKNGFYLKQFIKGRQQGKGARLSKSFIKSLGILDMKIL